MAGNEQPGKARIYLLRREQQKEWLAEAESGDETAKLVMSAASKRMSDLATEPSGCFCCDRVFLPGEIPRAFIVLIPTERDPAKGKATAGAVCVECGKHDDEWLIDQGLKGLSRLP
jgi:hypothetical protein